MLHKKKTQSTPQRSSTKQENLWKMQVIGHQTRWSPWSPRSAKVQAIETMDSIAKPLT